MPVIVIASESICKKYFSQTFKNQYIKKKWDQNVIYITASRVDIYS